ncbi:MAG: D-glycerate dehydrogenase [Candidatus Nephthysia bennettiae]|nr:MAG: D-glycerate dehydrogenase [Candidatus Dormibacteraeota bacterium]
MAEPTLTQRPLIAVSRAVLPGDGVHRLEAIGTVVRFSEPHPPNPQELAELAADAEALLCTSNERIDAWLLDRCPRLRVVATASAGSDHLDLAELTRRQIAAANVPGVLTETVADTTWGLILAAVRRIVDGDRFVRAGDWARVDLDVMVGLDLHGGTLGIVGYGGVGRAVARRAAGFEMTVRHYDRETASDEHSTWQPLDELLSQSDVVTVHTPLTVETRHLISARELALMKPTAVLVNTSRGPVVDQVALATALQEERLFAAALDVFEVEPIPLDDPLLELDNCIAVPHIASASVRTREQTVSLAVNNIIAALSGRPLITSLNPEVQPKAPQQVNPISI